MRGSVRLLFAPAWILASVVLVGSAFAQTAPKVVSASQSACPDTIRDVDRIACWVSAPPAPVPGAGPKPAPAFAARVGTAPPSSDPSPRSSGSRRLSSLDHASLSTTSWYSHARPGIWRFDRAAPIEPRAAHVMVNVSALRWEVAGSAGGRLCLSVRS